MQVIMMDTAPEEGYLNHPAWIVSRLTELMLTGHNWKEVRKSMLMSKPEFDRALAAAVDKAKAEQARLRHQFGDFAPFEEWDR